MHQEVHMSDPIFDAMAFQQSVYKDGMAAFDDEIALDECPYEADSTHGILWAEGWEQAAYIAERESKMAAEDMRLDDPRHGQGTTR
jgi:hypothetical protein